MSFEHQDPRREAAGIRLSAFEMLDRVAQQEAPEAPSVWCYGDLPLALQNNKVLGSPLSHDEFVEAHLARFLGTRGSVGAASLAFDRAVGMSALAPLRERSCHVSVAGRQAGRYSGTWPWTLALGEFSRHDTHEAS